MASRLRRALQGAALATLVLAGTGCDRSGVLRRRIEAIDDRPARQIVADCIWKHGSIYRWEEHETIRFEAAFVEHTDVGDVTTPEVWLLDTEDNRARIERAGPGDGGPVRTVLSDGRHVGVYSAGRELADPVAVSAAAGHARMVRELSVLPFSLLAKDRRFAYAGLVRGPAGSRAWHRVRVAYEDDAKGRMVLQVRDRTRQVTGVEFEWPEPPWAGRRLWVEMDDWRRTGELLFSHRWRFHETDAEGRPAGPPVYTVRLERIDLDVQVPRGAFSKP